MGCIVTLSESPLFGQVIVGDDLVDCIQRAPQVVGYSLLSGDLAYLRFQLGEDLETKSTDNEELNRALNQLLSAKNHSSKQERKAAFDMQFAMIAVRFFPLSFRF